MNDIELLDKAIEIYSRVIKQSFQSFLTLKNQPLRLGETEG